MARKITARSIDLGGLMHNSLSGIQGGAKDGEGNVTEAYHLTTDELTDARAILAMYNDLELIVAAYGGPDEPEETEGD